jgi:hypothetical protein
MPQTVVAYTWATADDLPERDPIAWAVDLSLDCSTWTNAYDVRAHQAITQTRGAWAGQWCGDESARREHQWPG